MFPSAASHGESALLTLALPAMECWVVQPCMKAADGFSLRVSTRRETLTMANIPLELPCGQRESNGTAITAIMAIEHKKA